ncbi:hypothetical protein Tco_0583478 [Tanacetum coccineum]
MMVYHEKVVRILLEGDEILRLHGECSQGVVKTLMNTKVDEPKLSDISVVQDFIDVFPEDLLMTTTTTSYHSGGLLAGIHGLFSGRYCGLDKRVTYGYPWPGLEGNHRDFGIQQDEIKVKKSG